MRGRRIDVVLVKLCAVVIVVLAMQGVTGYVAFYVNTVEATFIALTASTLNFVLPVAIAAVLWFFPATVVGDISDDAQAIESGVDLALLAITLIGLYTLVFGVIDLVYFESFRVAERSIIDPDKIGIYRPSPDTVAGRMTNIVQIIIGLALLVGKKSISRLLLRARTMN